MNQTRRTRISTPWAEDSHIGGWYLLRPREVTVFLTLTMTRRAGTPTFYFRIDQLSAIYDPWESLDDPHVKRQTRRIESDLSLYVVETAFTTHMCSNQFNLTTFLSILYSVFLFHPFQTECHNTAVRRYVELTVI